MTVDPAKTERSTSRNKRSERLLRFHINWVKDGFHDQKMVQGTLEECRTQAQGIIDRVRPETFWSAEAS